MRICVIDGQGGGIGSVIVKRIREAFQDKVEVIALGTNGIATAQMMKAGANMGASGENAIVQTVASAHVIVGPLGIILAHAMMGEITPKMAQAISASPAKKLLLPLTRENVEVVGVVREPLPHLVEKIISEGLRGLIE
ncbi:MAG TPA: DUF3842 family protein [Syntrophaceae bacterium]|nr:DUF3842 family protein [Syntrophaceae bacterium]